MLMHRLVLGCHQCSQRRINCDRGEPHCKKCSVRGLECSGLGIRYRFQNDTSSYTAQPRKVLESTSLGEWHCTNPMESSSPREERIIADHHGSVETIEPEPILTFMPICTVKLDNHGRSTDTSETPSASSKIITQTPTDVVASRQPGSPKIACKAKNRRRHNKGADHLTMRSKERCRNAEGLIMELQLDNTPQWKEFLLLYCEYI